MVRNLYERLLYGHLILNCMTILYEDQQLSGYLLLEIINV